MKVLVLIHEYPPIGGGGGHVAKDLCKGLAECGHDLKVPHSKPCWWSDRGK